MAGPFHHYQGSNAEDSWPPWLLQVGRELLPGFDQHILGSEDFLEFRLCFCDIAGYSIVMKIGDF